MSKFNDDFNIFSESPKFKEAKRDWELKFREFLMKIFREFENNSLNGKIFLKYLKY